MKNKKNNFRSLSSSVPDPVEVDFPIDIVYTWVDGSDEEWRSIRQQYEPTQENIPADSLAAQRLFAAPLFGYEEALAAAKIPQKVKRIIKDA